uniref:Uncharacterized protein n=1 Tax=Cynoglossus semilaevis TaxID=244447 RepID=A0A3P8WTV4_CYNSE
MKPCPWSRDLFSSCNKRQQFLRPQSVCVCVFAESQAASFPWSCPSLSGVCRKVCLPTELFFGPLGCGKGFLCCVSHFL